MKKNILQLALVIFALSGPLWGMEQATDLLCHATLMGRFAEAVSLVAKGATITPEALLIAGKVKESHHYDDRRHIGHFFNWWIQQCAATQALLKDPSPQIETLKQLIIQDKSDDEITRAITGA